MNVIVINKYKEMIANLDIEVIKSLEGTFDVEEIIESLHNFYFDRMIIDVTAIKDYQNAEIFQKLSINFDMNRIILLLDDSEACNSPVYLSKLISIGIYNFTRNSDGIKYLMQTPNSYRDVVHLHLVNDSINNANNIVKNDTIVENETINKVIGVKSLTESAGATTLIYLMKKALENYYSTSIIEVDKNDMHFFDSIDFIRTNGEDLPKELMKKRDCEVILVDLNNYSDPDVCSEVLYLIEPSIMKLNKLLLKDRKLSDRYKNKKIVLNKSFVKNVDLKDFEFETKLKVFANLPCLNDRDDFHNEVSELLISLGLDKIKTNNKDESKNKLLGMFKI